jgi:hypothetical protein
MHAELCPVCLGTGHRERLRVPSSEITKETICHGCGGRGWVEIEDSTPQYMPYYPLPSTPYYYQTPTPCPYCGEYDCRKIHVWCYQCQSVQSVEGS